MSLYKKKGGARMLYHKDVYIPEDIKYKLNALSPVQLIYSRHAILAAQDDKYLSQGIKLVKEITFTYKNVIELELTAAGIVKLVVRLSYNKDLDITYVIGKGGLVRTVWLNLKTDLHKTLDHTKYTKNKVA